jgi:hypothetical protein
MKPPLEDNAEFEKTSNNKVKILKNTIQIILLNSSVCNM